MKAHRVFPHSLLALVVCCLPLYLHSTEPPAALSKLQDVRRIVFLGDSITYAGQYVEFIEAYYSSRFPERQLEFLNLGLPSETVSGLSEEAMPADNFPGPTCTSAWAGCWKRRSPTSSSPVTG